MGRVSAAFISREFGGFCGHREGAEALPEDNSLLLREEIALFGEIVIIAPIRCSEDPL